MGLFKKSKLEKELIAFIIENKESCYRIAYSYVGNQEDALDIVQDAIHKSLIRINTLENQVGLKSWFYKIVVNTSLDHLRKHKRLSVVDDTVMEVLANGREDEYHHLDLQEAIDHLPDKYKTIIILRYFEDMKIEEIAKIVGENVNTVKTRLYRALKILKVELDEDSTIEEEVKRGKKF
ncbi:sigma-70 family RNA polymerase sigma factor [Oceanobacillus profundus]|uniref:Sigma-70 family RNA polymerase sigma factor n=1 Tax=Oceanobacillus profundus TaxID=372463 RepID=A0A417YKN8_9BACI|nr:sigma-70 family RNA polymerase sigma factor [Oceanobacillus profundus]MBR3119426.1 sigma-70 family RNA polymerase sigma factor [Oceanobacillus sp.]PAE29986.1 RNA polymerase subunit sigma-70 [Paenibacillus sp. 7884-2]MCM3396306.1 sigma-70 family RNA polymerase sigma factor [Oceanobacillus profundus]MDO6449684.1 sigma-70 family RNA polymerase sigma factor [Oceanobacillus profundus]RHW33686.1 sigma-70 family RNA polymerase sigma factor [Oceanobacillus profundus]